MCHLSRLWILFAILLFGSGAYGAQPPVTATSACNFDTDKQVAVQYQQINVDTKKQVFGREIPYGRVWAPGGKPITLFANTPVTIGSTRLPIGAYTLFVLPSEKQWTLVVSKSTDASGKYDKQMDLARIPMEYGQLGSPENEFTVYFAHVAPRQCSMRLDLDQSRAWVILQQQ